MSGTVPIDPLTSCAEEAAFTWAVNADPTDRTSRLVYADWLADRGGELNEAVGAFVRFLTNGNSLDDLDHSPLRPETVGSAIQSRRLLALFYDRANRDQALADWRWLPGYTLAVELSLTDLRKRPVGADELYTLVRCLPVTRLEFSDAVIGEADFDQTPAYRVNYAPRLVDDLMFHTREYPSPEACADALSRTVLNALRAHVGLPPLTAHHDTA